MFDFDRGEGGLTVQPTGINPSLIRILPSTSPDLLAELLTPGKVLDADVVSVFQDRAILSFGRGVRLEVALQAPLQEGQRVRVQVQAQPGAGAAPAPAQQVPAQAGPDLPAPVPQAPVFMPRPNIVVQGQQLAVTAEMPSLVTVESEPAQAAPPAVTEQAPAGQQPAVPAEGEAQAQSAAQQAEQAAPQPQTEQAAAPQTQQAVPQTQQAAPQTQQAAPQTQQAVPQTQQTASQTQQAAPQAQQQPAPQTQQEAAPPTQQEAAPPTQQQAAPLTQQAQPTGAQAQQAAPQTQQAAAQPEQAAPQAPAGRPAPAAQPAPSAPTTVSAFVARQAAGLGTGPQQLLRPMALPQSGAPAAQPQPQTPTAARQPVPTPTPAPAQQPAGNPPPVVLKVIATLPPKEAAPLPDQPAAAAAAKATGAAAAVREALTPTSGQPAPVSNQQPAQPQSAAQVFWLPVPLPDGRRGWAQLHIQEDDSPKARGAKGGPTHEVRIWWETPALGAVQVTLDAAADKLAALFTAAAPESKGALETLLPELQRRLSQVGFPEARVGCRTAAPGEAVEPARAQGASRLDKRL